MPASSALRTNFTHPFMSGSAAGESDLVVATREVSCAVFIATSPPFGIIQWNLRFMIQRLPILCCTYALDLFQVLLLGLPNEGQNVTTERDDLIDLRPPGQDELSDSNFLEFKQGVGDI